ncbi:hypothetical protein GCM10011363_44190 [Marivita lacus]|uniref:Uncharacterized protein n=1 Tax=Marivita lacus TaxID=1323742 RepID=A0ABQ1LFT8_9RHOB|nr:hypothetical protein [Marivita lacus]GGC22791.1 hypothetical protein GCM10011363_44190 [Marivita lacus]
MDPLIQTYPPTPGTDLNNLAVEFVICDETGRPRRKQIFGVLQLLRSKLAPLRMQ